MAFKLKFNTTPSNKGKSILINDCSESWIDFSELVTEVHVKTSIVNDYINIHDSNGDVVDSVLNVFTGTIDEGFQYEITNIDIGLDEDYVIQDAIYLFEITLYNGTSIISTEGYEYSSKELTYFIANTIMNKELLNLSYECNINISDKSINNSLFIISQIEGIIAASANSNSGLIYSVLDNIKIKYPNDYV